MSKDHRFNKDDLADSENYSRKEHSKKKWKKDKNQRDKRKKRSESSFDFEDFGPMI